MQHNLRYFIVLATVAASVNFAHAQALTEQEFIDTHVGKCVSYTGASTGIECYSANGRATYDDETWGKDRGRWTYRNGYVCLKWSKEDEADCGRYIRKSDGSFTDGEEYIWTIIQ